MISIGYLPSVMRGGKKLKGVKGEVFFENGMLFPPPTIF
jgi:hypothetical protein